MTEGLNQNSISYNIDDIATDLNNKADRDLQNLVSPCTVLDGQWQRSLYFVATGVTYPTTTDLVYDLSSYLPNDGYRYEVLFTGYCTIAAASGSMIRYQIGNSLGGYVWLTGGYTRTNSAMTYYGSTIMTIDTDRIIEVSYHSGSSGTFTLNAEAYRRTGTNL